LPITCQIEEEDVGEGRRKIHIKIYYETGRENNTLDNYN
jgi:hypothetical protein